MRSGKFISANLRCLPPKIVKIFGPAAKSYIMPVKNDGNVKGSTEIFLYTPYLHMQHATITDQ